MEMTNGRAKTIGIFGHYGNLNLGDEAIITAVIENVKQRYPQARLYGFSIHPDETESRYGMPSFPIRPLVHTNESPSSTNSVIIAEPSSDKNETGGLKRTIKSVIKKTPLVMPFINGLRALPGLIKDLPRQMAFNRDSYRTLKSVDHLLIAGSNQFLDNFGGPWGFPFTLLRWSVLAKLAGVKISYISVGAGPLDSKLSFFLCRAALLFADYVSFRDVASQKMILPHAKNGKAKVFPDLAFSLMNPKTPTNGKHSKPLVGINVMAIYDPRYWCEPDGGKYSTYINNLSAFASRLIQDNVDVFFFGTQKKDESVMNDVLNVLAEAMGTELDTSVYTRTSESVYGLLDVITEADVIVATRFHGTVLSLFSGKPTLGICYYRKAADLLNATGHGDYYVTVDEFDPDELYRKFKRLMAEQQESAQKLENVLLNYKHQLAVQYDRVLA